MKSGITCFLVVFTIVCAVATADADHHLELSDELKPLQFMIGNWAVEWEGDDGAKMKFTRTTEPVAGGHAIHQSGQFYRNGEPGFSLASLIFKKKALRASPRLALALTVDILSTPSVCRTVRSCPSKKGSTARVKKSLRNHISKW